VGLVISAGGRFIVQAVPWVALLIGVALILLGLGMLMGHHLSAGFAARLAQRIGTPGSRGLRSYFVFAIAYAVASLSCTLPIFLTVVGGSLAASGLASATWHFFSYALGMGLIILALTTSIAAFKGTLLRTIRKTLPYFERVSALLMVLAGSYIVYYWLFKGGLIHSFT
jgi:cytochrome c biogenesis protein CcdA